MREIYKIEKKRKKKPLVPYSYSRLENPDYKNYQLGVKSISLPISYSCDNMCLEQSNLVK